MTTTAPTPQISEIVEGLRARLGGDEQPRHGGAAGAAGPAPAPPGPGGAGPARRACDTPQSSGEAGYVPRSHRRPGPGVFARLGAAAGRREVQVPAGAALATGIGAFLLRRR
jgi:hypothetical protein